ncbi:MAG: cysteine desulfurase family protein [Pseudomonadota bacterium]
MDRIYLDHNATSPLRPVVTDAVTSFVSQPFGNPSSIHEEGRRTRQALDRAREEVAAFLGVPPGEIVFTSGGTEANHLAWNSFARPDARIATTAVEHPSILAAAESAAKRGATIVHLGIDRNGKLDEEALRKLIETGADLLSIQAANNETGILFSVDEIIQKVRGKVRTIHVDAVQAVGKIDLDGTALGADLISISGHKLGALPGTGALYARKGSPFESIWQGGHQERGKRTGTENIVGIVALGAACRHLSTHRAEETERIQRLRDRFESEVLRKIPGAQVTGFGRPRLPNTSHIRFDDLDGESLLIAADLEGISCSAGAACSSGSIQPSHVLLAMGMTEAEARGSIRFSLGWSTTKKEVARALELLPRLVTQVREKTEKRVRKAAL